MPVVSSFPGDDGCLAKFDDGYDVACGPEFDRQRELGPNMSAFLTKADVIMAEILDKCKREGQASRRDLIIGASNVGS